MYKITSATYNDIDDIVLNGKYFHDYSLKDKYLKYNNEDMSSTIRFLIDNDITEVFVSRDNLTFQGCIGGIVSPWFGDYSQLVLTEQFWWVNPKYRNTRCSIKLLKKLIEWGKSKGANLLMMISVGSDKENTLQKYYNKNDFRYVESHFIKEI